MARSQSAVRTDEYTALGVPRLFDTNRLTSPVGEASLHDLVQAVRPRLDPLPDNAPAVFVVHDDREAVQVAAWLCATRRDGMVLPRERWTEPLAARCRQGGFAIVDATHGRMLEAGQAEAEDGRVWLVTSGTTCEPKLVAHSWDTLYTAGRARPLPPLRWLIVYQPGTYAWYQVVTLLFFVPGQSAVIGEGREPEKLIAAAARWDADAISATPTFWRMALLSADPDDLRTLEPRCLSLGGETVDQDVLDQLHDLFPNARLRHIYASTELGACIVVPDGRAGFPAVWLDDDEREPRLRVRGGRLQICSPHAGLDFEGWVDTGDEIKIEGDRAYFQGRNGSAQINVGGDKASIADIERVLLAHPHVLWCRVQGIKAPLLGHLVTADVVQVPERAHKPLDEAELTRHCAEVLPDHMVPRLLNQLPEIPATGNFKSGLAGSRPR